MRADIQHTAEMLVHEALDGLCTDCGVAVAPVGSWGARACRSVPRPDAPPLELVHDERGAPYDAYDKDLLVSLTDEGDICACVWAKPRRGSGLVGVGIDLASPEDFAGERGKRFNELLFSPAEQSFVRERYQACPEVGFAYAFSGKEAAFKSLAAPLRTWYESHADQLEFEVREFELADATHARGTLRHACAQAAMDAMGVRAIELVHHEWDDLVLTLALAFGVAGGGARPSGLFP